MFITLEWVKSKNNLRGFMKKYLIYLFLFLSSCTTTEIYVKNSIDGGQAIVALGETGLLEPGDKVGFYTQTCRERKGRFSDISGSSTTQCQKRRIGLGEVLRIVSENEALIEVKNGVALREGMLVEKE
ncbi:MAG: hypothetical protein B7Y39_04340 [Bdellovibrio sp. 28-41-41]|nr:MAG: hypothetical protein B7Y39_04340 [Bdellovibrio sp. 28-41-41]